MMHFQPTRNSKSNKCYEVKLIIAISKIACALRLLEIFWLVERFLIHGAFKNNINIDLLKCRCQASYCAIIGFQLLAQHKLLPSFSCQFFYEALQRPLFTVKYYEFVLKITEKHTNRLLRFTKFKFLNPIYCIQKAGEANIFAKLRQRSTIFLAQDLTSYVKIFFVSGTIFCIGFVRTEKKYVKVK